MIFNERELKLLWATQREGKGCTVQLFTNYHLAVLKHVDLLLVDCVLVFLQETLTLVLHLGPVHRGLFHMTNQKHTSKFSDWWLSVHLRSKAQQWTILQTVLGSTVIY